MERCGIPNFLSLEELIAGDVVSEGWYDGRCDVDFSNGKDVWDGEYICVNENENKNGFLYR